MSDLEAKLSAIGTQTTINSVISGLIVCLSIIKPILLEYIRRRWYRQEESRKASRASSVESL
jgi:hypothetical protein